MHASSSSSHGKKALGASKRMNALRPAKLLSTVTSLVSSTLERVRTVGVDRRISTHPSLAGRHHSMNDTPLLASQ